MRWFAPVVALLAAVASAQTSTTQQNAIVIPNGGLSVTAGQNTISWTNPSSGTVTIKLQQGSDITPTSGYTLASGISASAGTATFTIPAGAVNTAQYVFEIIDEQNTSNINFSTNFVVVGATGTATGFPSSTGTAASSASSASSVSSRSSASMSSMSSASSASASSSSMSESSSRSSSSSASRTSASASSSSASASATMTTAAPNSGAGSVKVQGGFVALIAGAIAML